MARVAAIQREMVEQIAEIDVDTVADRDDGGKADAAAGGPFAPVRPQSRRIARSARDRRPAAAAAAKLALSFAPGTSTPRQLGPTRRMPAARAVCSQSSASEPGPWPSPAVMMMPAAVPLRAAAATASGTAAGGTAMTTTSGASGKIVVGFDGANALDLVVARIDQVNGAGKAAAAQIFEHRPPRRGQRGDAPMTATDRGANSVSRR